MTGAEKRAKIIAQQALREAASPVGTGSPTSAKRRRRPMWSYSQSKPVPPTDPTSGAPMAPPAKRSERSET
jgi:hypothetical protein